MKLIEFFRAKDQYLLETMPDGHDYEHGRMMGVHNECRNIIRLLNACGSAEQLEMPEEFLKPWRGCPGFPEE